MTEGLGCTEHQTPAGQTCHWCTDQGELFIRTNVTDGQRPVVLYAFAKRPVGGRRRSDPNSEGQHGSEINNHDWSDAPYRVDRAGHRREHDRGWESA